jgi:hypothetical protein
MPCDFHETQPISIIEYGDVTPIHLSMNYRMRKLSECLRGWMAYFALSEYYRPVPELDEWIRRCLRMWIAFHYPASNQPG